MKILLLLFIIFFSIAGVHAETAQYYNETSGQMEVPIYMIGGVTTENYVSYCSLENGNLSVFADIAGNGDKVKRYNAVTGSFVSATYFNGVWYGFPDDVEPIEAGVGYMYERAPANGNTTWKYDTEFYCAENGGTVVETVYVSPDYEDVALLFYIFIIPILYLFIAFKKKESTISLSMIFLIFAFFIVLHQVITIPINIIYLIIFSFLFIISITGITLKQGKQGAD